MMVMKKELAVRRLGRIDYEAALALQKEIERRLAAKKLSLMLMQVLERPADVNPSVTRALRAQGK